MDLLHVLRLSPPSTILSSQLRVPSVVHGKVESRRLVPVSKNKKPNSVYIYLRSLFTSH